MDVSAQTLREVEFREKLRGYHPDDVDEFLERVAAGIEFLQDRLREATDRAARAEQRVAEGGDDDALKRTLVLAQRTAELAVQEAREEASRIQSQAQVEASAIVARAEAVARSTIEEAQGPLRDELTELEAARDALRADIAVLERHLERERANLRAKLSEALSLVETAVPPATPLPPLHEIAVPAMRVPSAADIDIDLDDVPHEPAEERPPEPERAPEPEPEFDRELAMAAPPPPPPPPQLEEPVSPFAAVGEEAPEREPAGTAMSDERRAMDTEPAGLGVPAGTAMSDERRAMDTDDPFLAELRRAITDPEPLGPRDEERAVPDAQDGDLQHEDLLEGSRLGSLLRRKR